MSARTLDPRLVSLTSPASIEAEQFQSLRLKIERLQRDRGVRAIAITSPGARDGKTVSAINLAAALAGTSGARILLIEADLRRPSICRYLGIDDADAPGLTTLVLEPERTLEQTVRPYPGFGFDLLPSGSTSVLVKDILRSPRLEAVLKRARELYDFVILDTPPVGAVSDSAVIAPWLDGLLVVVSANQTSRKQLEAALNTLDGPSVLGIIFNRDNHRLFGYRYRSRYFKTAIAHPPSSSGLTNSAHQ